MYGKPPEVGGFLAAVAKASGAFDDVSVWPENWPAVALFSVMSTQWRTTGMNGIPYGLDYGVLHRELDDLELAGDDRQQMKADIRVMEAEALEAIREQQQ